MTRLTDIRELKGHIRYPLPPTAFSQYANEIDTYVRFMRHLRITAYSRADLKILSAIQFTADMTGMDDGDVARTLVDLGLRAPREAFPAAFLNQMDQAVCRMAFGEQELSPALGDLLVHWRFVGSGAADEVPAVMAGAGPECCTASLIHA